MASWTRNKIGWSTRALLAIGVQAASTRAEDAWRTAVGAQMPTVNPHYDPARASKKASTS